MFTLFSNASLNQLVPVGLPDAGAVALGEDGLETGGAGVFAQLLSAQTSKTEMLEELKVMLSADDFQQLESMLEEDNLLPVAEIVAALRQQLSASGIGQLPTQTLPISGLIPFMQKHSAVTPEYQSVAIKQSASIPSDLAGQSALAVIGFGDQAAEVKQKLSIESLHAVETAGPHAVQKATANVLFRTVDSGVIPLSGLVAGQVPNQQNFASPVNLIQATPMPVDVPPGEKGWDQAMGERILWMVGRQLQGAAIRITPPHLGPIDIRILIHNDQANVSFAAHHGVVRDALEAAIPRLREMLGENNLQLVNVDVNQRGSGEQRMSSGTFKQASSEDGNGASESFELDDEMAEKGHILAYRSDGLVDDFA
ncbi:hypothetical protein MNBD_GAMMA26-1994 [hydrothermal vent metagenome]|uniref:Flagellar hook-length control protein-like C-terminal domain-containing protein n=1 Tax=hydrothermal vent metagenome TaxID=652676 RepID=A0A3B1BL56_9ZZZZ